MATPKKPTNSKTLAQLIEEGPGGGTVLDERQPIGVPSGYVASRTTKTYGERYVGPAGSNDVTVDAPPRYFDGDDLGPAGLSPTDIAKIQLDLVAAGLLTGKFRKGYWDAASQKAYAQALAYANQTGRDVKRALAELKTHPENAGTDEDRPPLVVKTTSPDDLRGVFRDTSRKLLGRQLSDQELEQYISAYNQVETQKQQQAYDMDPTGGTMAEIPSANSYVEERLRRERPTDVKVQEVGSRADEFFSLLGSFGGD